MDFISGIFETVGPVMFLGLIGLYLIIVAIVGQFVPRNIRLKTIKQRTLLGAFGFVLFVPTLLSLYIEFFTKFSPSLFSPDIQEQIIENEQVPGDSLGSLQPRSLMQFAVYRNSESMAMNRAQSKSQKQTIDCRRVEFFGLPQNNIRGLKNSRFKKNVYVYVGDIYYNTPFDVYVVVGENTELPKSGKFSESQWQEKLNRYRNDQIYRLRVQKAGESLEFRHAGKTYRMTVLRIYVVLFGKDKIVVEICEKNA